MSVKTLLLLGILVLAGYRALSLFAGNISLPMPSEDLVVDEPFAFSGKLAKDLVNLARTDRHSEAVQPRSILFFIWDDTAVVYVAVGADNAPGVAGVDDDGNAIVDDRSELGATGSDDRVLTPDDDGYDDAASGKVVALVLSRGAMKRVAGDTVVNGPGQVRIDVIDSQNRMTSKIVDLN